MRSKMVVYRDGIRYWATKGRSRHNGRKCIFFWSSHPWPFYHASYQPTVFDRQDIRAKFLEWIPCIKADT